ncbi:CD225/dispanin family protein [Robiginitalea sp. M366]|uniref:CD225/dispanin family protein n=1 Tax=Robiginitalea aestuariiviva TaxID=3036903 RepID=UPI00240D2A70|nr:CD225/dispanin family protein [Robiginitalea aestuariiviva]MDG1572414.1 CD225/dispanin family protein [Robiginitalea aestuariiviva]
MSELSNAPAKPNNYLVLAIICTVCCCLPAGIVSIVYAAKVNETYARGEYDLAQQYSRNARTWGIVGLVVGGIGVILYVGLIGFGAFASILENAQY